MDEQMDTWPERNPKFNSSRQRDQFDIHSLYLLRLVLGIEDCAIWWTCIRIYE